VLFLSKIARSGLAASTAGFGAATPGSPGTNDAVFRTFVHVAVAAFSSGGTNLGFENSSVMKGRVLRINKDGAGTTLVTLGAPRSTRTSGTICEARGATLVACRPALPLAHFTVHGAWAVGALAVLEGIAADSAAELGILEMARTGVTAITAGNGTRTPFSPAIYFVAVLRTFKTSAFRGFERNGTKGSTELRLHEVASTS